MRIRIYMLFLQTHPPTLSPTQAPPKMVQGSKPSPDQIPRQRVYLKRAPGSKPRPNAKTPPKLVHGSKPSPDQIPRKRVYPKRAPGSNPRPSSNPILRIKLNLTKQLCLANSNARPRDVS